MIQPKKSWNMVMCMMVGIITKIGFLPHHSPFPAGEEVEWKKSVPPLGGTFRLIGGGWEGLSLFFGGSKLRLGTEAQMECVVSEYRYSA